MKRSTKQRFCVWMAVMMVVTALSTPLSAMATNANPKALSPDWQGLLSRPYVSGVPLGYNEDVYSLYQSGWGFDEKAIYRSGCKDAFGMKVEITVDGKPLRVSDATHTPSFVTMTGGSNTTESTAQLHNHARDTGMTYTVSFAQTDYGANAAMAFDGDTETLNNTWNTWCPTPRNSEEWLRVDFSKETKLDTIRLWLYTDQNTYAPQTVKVQYLKDGAWADAENVQVPSLQSGQNDITLKAVTATSFRLTFTPYTDKAMSFVEIALMESVYAKQGAEIAATGYKYVSPKNLAATLYELKNDGDQAADVTVAVTPLYNATASDNAFSGTVSGLSLFTGGDEAFVPSQDRLVATFRLAAGERRSVRAATAFADKKEDAQKALSAWLQDEQPIETQTEAFLSWFDENVPYVDLPDTEMQQIYYYRWYTYRSHIRRLADGSYVVTEFLPYVGWSGPHNTINMPLGSHAAEGRWIRDTKYLNSALTFWIDREGTQNARAFSTWLPTAFYRYFLVTRDPMVTEHLAALKADYSGWESTNYTKSIGLFWSNNGADGMEYSASKPKEWGVNGYRPTVNAYRYGDATAIAALADFVGDEETAKRYRDKAEILKKTANETLFDEKESFYKWIVLGTVEKTDARELIGYVPWMFGMAEDSESYAAAWRYLTDDAFFAAPYGPRTVEKAFARKTPAAEYGSGVCRWDGPSWPFATSQTLNALATFLNDYTHHGDMDAQTYAALLKTYAHSQYKDGYPWIAEDLDADTGKWIADIDRSVNYNHSEYANHVISGLIGLRPELSDDVTVRPLVPDTWDYFCLENASYNGKRVTVLFDREGTRYGLGKGFFVLVDGEIRHRSDRVEAVRIAENGEASSPNVWEGPLFWAAMGVLALVAGGAALPVFRKNRLKKKA